MGKLPKRKEIFVRSYDDMQWRHIDLNQLSLAEGDASLSFLVEASNQKFQDVVKQATLCIHAWRYACLRQGAGGVLWRTPNKSLGNHERLPQLTRLPPPLGQWRAVHTFENTSTSAPGAHMHNCDHTLCTLLLQNLQQHALLKWRPH